MRFPSSRVWGRALIVLGATQLVMVLAVLAGAWWFQTMEARRLHRRTPTHPSISNGRARAARAEARGRGSIGLLEIPRLGVSVVLVEGTGARALRHGAGHVERTTFPASPGNAVRST